MMVPHCEHACMVDRESGEGDLVSTAGGAMRKGRSSNLSSQLDIQLVNQVVRQSIT